MNRILLADSNYVLRSALALLLETRLDVLIVGQVSSMESLLCEAAATQPDIVIVGLGLPDEPDDEWIATLRTKAPRTNIMLVSACPKKVNLAEGTDAFIFQTDLPETILQVIQSLNKRTGQKEVCHV
jgi:DNA-binding NarL/FixJ family response regulator